MSWISTPHRDWMCGNCYCRRPSPVKEDCDNCAKIAELKTAEARSSAFAKSALDRNVELEAQIAELDQDKERLDWLEANLDIVGPDAGLIEFYRIAGDDDNPFNVQRNMTGFGGEETIRAAIDAARKESS